jgi:poly-beta-1,6-N-acetyl-D-glucosamine biosynthesis protein PgaD
VNYIPVTQSRRSRKNKELASGTKTLCNGLKSLLYIAVWAFLLYILQPFITAVVWWKGYQLMVGNASSLSTIDGTFTVIEYVVYFSILIILVLLSWAEWNNWRFFKPREK